MFFLQCFFFFEMTGPKGRSVGWAPVGCSLDQERGFSVQS